MTDRKDFLVELGTEELPPKALRKLGEAFAQGIKTGLEKAELEFGQVSVFCTPRRLACVVKKLQTHQADKATERRGPALQAAFKEDGCPTPAAEGFARSCGVEVSALDTLTDGKNSWLVYRSVQLGQAVTSLLPEIVSQSLNSLPIPKRMRWGSNTHEFVRPAHWLVMLYGNDVVACELMGHKAGRESFGHRFHKPSPLEIPNAEAYETLLETEGHVVASFERRKTAIRAQVEEAGISVEGIAQIDDSLLDEVTGLVEWPVAVIGRFDEKFLQVPSEALISAMKGHQKYFHVTDSQNRLLPYFITVSNIESKNIESVRQGNERVIRPRLTDADFFWKQDLKTPLIHFQSYLKDVVFQNQLGSLLDKSKRVASLAGSIADELKGESAHAKRAGLLSKCDLMSKMVGEFPELQGIMGQYYAQHQKEDSQVALALFEQYLPRFAGDHLPSSSCGQAVAIADKLDTLIGIFGIGQKPTGDKDPFALRRASLGILRIIIEKELPLNLMSLIQHAEAAYTDIKLDAHTRNDVFEFMLDRLKAYYQEQGISLDVYDAVHSTRPARPVDFDRRVKAVAKFKSMPASESLAAANKRIGNILKKTEQIKFGNIDPNLLSEKHELVLFEQIGKLESRVASFTAEGKYHEALSELAGLKDSVDAFFDNVMVMAEDKAIQNNRLNLLHKLNQQFLAIADISKLQTA